MGAGKYDVEKAITTKTDNRNQSPKDVWTYTYTVNLKGVKCSNPTKQPYSVSKTINVYKLLITKFQDYKSKKPWKVVVGQDIEAVASASPDVSGFNWEMPDLFNATEKSWRLQVSNTYYVKIPFSDLSINGAGTVNRVKNADFGDKYGCVVVSCKDNSGNGVTHITASRNTTASYDFLMNPAKGAKVFFPMNVTLTGLPTYPKGIPNRSVAKPIWYIFWKEGNVVEALT